MKKIVLASILVTLVLSLPIAAEDLAGRASSGMDKLQPEVVTPSTGEYCREGAVGSESYGLPADAARLLGSPEVLAAAGSCSATADCHDGSTVGCSTSSGSCSFQDANCGLQPQQQGYVTCGSTTTQCPACPDACSGLHSCTSHLHCRKICGFIGCDDPQDGACLSGKCYCGVI